MDLQSQGQFGGKFKECELYIKCKGYAINRSAIIISASSDIGTAMCTRWGLSGWKVYGTYRTKSPAVKALTKIGIKLVHCDLSDVASIHDACSTLRKECSRWDVLVMCPGTQEPVGAFIDSSFDEWEKSLKVNFSSQLRIIHEMLPSRHVKAKLNPIVLLFAGGGTNNRLRGFSSNPFPPVVE